MACHSSTLWFAVQGLGTKSGPTARESVFFTAEPSLYLLLLLVFVFRALFQTQLNSNSVSKSNLAYYLKPSMAIRENISTAVEKKNLNEDL